MNRRFFLVINVLIFSGSSWIAQAMERDNINFNKAKEMLEDLTWQSQVEFENKHQEFFSKIDGERLAEILSQPSDKPSSNQSTFSSVILEGDEDILGLTNNSLTDKPLPSRHLVREFCQLKKAGNSYFKDASQKKAHTNLVTFVKNFVKASKNNIKDALFDCVFDEGEENYYDDQLSVVFGPKDGKVAFSSTGEPMHLRSIPKGSQEAQREPGIVEKAFRNKPMQTFSEVERTIAEQPLLEKVSLLSTGQKRCLIPATVLGVAAIISTSVSACSFALNVFDHVKTWYEKGKAEKEQQAANNPKPSSSNKPPHVQSQSAHNHKPPTHSV